MTIFGSAFVDTFQKVYAFFISFCCQNAPIATYDYTSNYIPTYHCSIIIKLSDFFPPWEVKKKKVRSLYLFFSHYIWHGTSFHMFRKASFISFSFSSLFSPAWSIHTSLFNSSTFCSFRMCFNMWWYLYLPFFFTRILPDYYFFFDIQFRNDEFQ